MNEHNYIDNKCADCGLRRFRVLGHTAANRGAEYFLYRYLTGYEDYEFDCDFVAAMSGGDIDKVDRYWERRHVQIGNRGEK